jgi:hypothetical protein
MAYDKNKHRKFDFILDKERDVDKIAFLESITHPGYSLADFVRDLIKRSMGGDVNAQSDVRLITEIQDLRQMMLAFDERLEGLELVQRHEEEIKHLWSEMGRMNERLESLRASGTVDDDALTTPLSDDAKRQAALSAKLKRINFGGLTQ